MRVFRTAAALLAVTLLLAGCSTAAEGPETEPPTTGPTPTATAEETASPTPAPDPADPATWTISAEGIGPVHIGGDFDGTLADLPTSWTSDGAACSWAAFWNAPDASFSMHFVRGSENQSDPISEVSASTMADAVSGPVGPVTAEGLGVGAARDEILAGYPDAEEGTGAVDGEWIRIPSDGEAQIFFQFLTGADLAWAVTVTTRDEPSYEVCG
ncbi:hypothetical protein [Microbacterium sp. CIAB417]|uniref:hypothetical protein n=1 Tax=Microbacterium sp. CIAB417 TaxID=2860287 RepID=UPI001FAC22FB|nr:hypothetical protein [Microbacterium sp. CIAB417]